MPIKATKPVFWPLLAVLLLAMPALAQEREPEPSTAQEAMAQEPQQSVGSWFKSLNVPGTKVSCCDEADCKRTQSRIGPAGYEAMTPEGRWISVPEQAVIRGKPNLAREPVLCMSPRQVIYCFVPDSEG